MVFSEAVCAKTVGVIAKKKEKQRIDKFLGIKEVSKFVSVKKF